MVSHFRIIFFQFVVPLALMICIFIISIGACDNYIFKIITESVILFIAITYLFIKTDKLIHKDKIINQLDPFEQKKFERCKITNFILWLIGNEDVFECCCCCSNKDNEKNLPKEILELINTSCCCCHKKNRKVSPSLEP